MKAGILFTNTGPILILTSCASFQEPLLLRQLEAKHIAKFIAYDVDIQKVRAAYGAKYKIAIGDPHQSDVLRVLDLDVCAIFNHFQLGDLGEPLIVEREQMESRV